MTLDRAIAKAQIEANALQETVYVVKDFDEYNVSDQYEIDGFFAGCRIIEAVEAEQAF